MSFDVETIKSDTEFLKENNYAFRKLSKYFHKQYTDREDMKEFIFTEEEIDKYCSSVLEPSSIFIYQILSERKIEKILHKYYPTFTDVVLVWYYISERQPLSINFIEKYRKHISFSYLRFSKFLTSDHLSIYEYELMKASIKR